MVVLQKWGKTSNELRALNFKLKVCIRELKALITVLEEILISYSHREDISENQIPFLIWGWANCKGKSNSQFYRISIVKIRALI